MRAMTEHPLVIAGGGIAGLYCARRLAEAGHWLLILETASDRWGGRIEPRELDGFIAEMGPMRRSRRCNRASRRCATSWAWACRCRPGRGRRDVLDETCRPRSRG
jgi:glycine/D-amino acid oxidase-like deaminating enzyme